MRIFVIAALAGLGLAACNTTQERVAGAGVGAAAGAAVGGPVGAVAGGAIGAATGPAVADQAEVPKPRSKRVRRARTAS